MNPQPMSTPTSASQRQLARSSARMVAHAASVIRSTSSASGLLKRNIRVATGVRASTAPASRPAAGLAQRRTVA
jgi:hypothetical protein